MLVAGQHEIALATFAGIKPEPRFLGALIGDANFAFLARIGDIGIFQALLYRLADLRACAAQEPLPVGETFALGIEPAIDEKGGHQIFAG